MAISASYPFLSVENSWGEIILRPVLPFELYISDRSVTVNALLDTGADVNILPYNVGLQIGADWSACPILPSPTGNLSKYETRGLAVNAVIGNFPSTKLGFAWVQSDHVPLLLGQINFFMQYDVCFFRASSRFELRPKST
jgi:hypothetical protein